VVAEAQIRQLEGRPTGRPLCYRRVEMKQLPSDLGHHGEDLAVDFFARRGYAVLARNWKCRYGELDLVIHQHGETRLIEVKTRRWSSPDGPREAVTDRKLARMGEAAARFFQEHPELDPEAHFDVLEVTFHASGVPVFRWLKDFE
jgi:putative endonuclease